MDSSIRGRARSVVVSLVLWQLKYRKHCDPLIPPVRCSWYCITVHCASAKHRSAHSHSEISGIEFRRPLFSSQIWCVPPAGQSYGRAKQLLVGGKVVVHRVTVAAVEGCCAPPPTHTPPDSLLWRRSPRVRWAKLRGRRTERGRGETA